MNYTINQIAAAIGATIVDKRAGSPMPELSVEWILTDSRSLVFPETSLFFALKTAKNDGHRYIGRLRERGVRSFVVSEVPDGVGDALFLVVADTLLALQNLAGFHRRHFDLPVVGITGSVGKTIVKEWLAQLINPAVGLVRSPRSYNSQIGVPHSLFLLDNRAGLALFEVGISEPGEMERLAPIVAPTIGVLTHLGDAHGENFGSRRDKCIEKMRLFHHSQAAVFPVDDTDVAEASRTLPPGVRCLTWSKAGREAWAQVRVEKDEETAKIDGIIGISDSFSIVIPFTDEASIDNAISAAVTLKAIELLYPSLPLGNWQEAATSLTPVSMHLEVREALRGCTLITDNYNSDLRALDLALDFMVSRSGDAERVVILSDVIGTGLHDSELYRRVDLTLRAHGVARLIAVGPKMGENIGVFSLPAEHFPSTGRLLRSSCLDSLNGCIVLLKGAAKFRFERIHKQFILRQHQTSLRVNLSALLHNLSAYRTLLGADRKIVCMIKADGYGTGAIEVAKTLQNAAVDYLAVAVADEGVALRRAGITSGIIVMNPEPQALRDMFVYSLQPEVYSFSLLSRLIEEARAVGATNLPIHIKIDSGMHRLGFDPNSDIDPLIALLKTQNALLPRSVFSHFAGADDEQFDHFTAEQFERFNRAATRICAAFPHHILRHICNTAGIARFPQYHCDMARLGIGLYGFHPGPAAPRLRNVATLRTVVLQLRTLTPPETVGYSRRGALKRPTTIADIPIGYADGLDRHLGNGRAYCLINGQRAPYVGNICMDMAMADVTDIPCREGDEVIIFGDDLPATELSDRLGTIPYEVLTSVSPRVVREYTQE